MSLTKTNNEYPHSAVFNPALAAEKQGISKQELEYRITPDVQLALGMTAAHAASSSEIQS